jgi:hypothetical protein
MNQLIRRELVNVIKKVLVIADFKRKFKKNPEKYFKSRKIFVTFKSHLDAWAFKTLYNRTYKFRMSDILPRKPFNYDPTKIIFRADNELSSDIKDEFLKMNNNKEVHMASDDELSFLESSTRSI